MPDSAGSIPHIRRTSARQADEFRQHIVATEHGLVPPYAVRRFSGPISRQPDDDAYPDHFNFARQADSEADTRRAYPVLAIQNNACFRRTQGIWDLYAAVSACRREIEIIPGRLIVRLTDGTVR